MRPVLVVNCGSSTLKAALVDPVDGRRRAGGIVERIGSQQPGRLAWNVDGASTDSLETIPDHAVAVQRLLPNLLASGEPLAVCHRVVHGGERFRSATLVNEGVLRQLAELSPLAPLHNPPALEGIAAARALLPNLPHVATFDTAFHADLPPAAYRYAIPKRLYLEHGIRRYGFHGHSHRWIAERAAVITGRSDLRLVSLHLGNGCSVAAIRDGQCVETSMGMTPLEGLVMGTRCGDLDPAVPLLLQQREGLTPDAVERLLNRESGLAALSGGISDMRDLEAAVDSGDRRARFAFDAFIHRLRKYVGAYAAVLGGFDLLAFTAGIGENSARVRAATLSGLEFLGIRLDEERNAAPGGGERRVSASTLTAAWVIPTNEELVMAREAVELLEPGGVGTTGAANPGVSE